MSSVCHEITAGPAGGGATLTPAQHYRNKVSSEYSLPALPKAKQCWGLDLKGDILPDCHLQPQDLGSYWL